MTQAKWLVRGRIGALLAVLTTLSGCRDRSPGEPPPLAAATVTLPVFSVSTFDGARRLSFRNDGRYAILPQFAASRSFAASGGASVPLFGFTLEGNAPVAAAVVSASVLRSGGAERPVSAAEAFHALLRDRERENAARVIDGAVNPTATSQLALSRSEPAPVRTFKVLSSLTTTTYATVTARLVHAGERAVLYVDTQSPVVGLSDAEYAAIGAQFDADLYPVAIRAFGAPADIDANGRTLVLYTPLVNRLTLNVGQCGTYVAGFFDSADLAGDARANRGEVLYAAVAGEPTGGASCSRLSADVVKRGSPATLIHELQHLISFSQHVLSRRGAQEETWLNEGLSHLAEELGGKVYEARYPCPAGPPCPSAGRANTSQLFPDSAQGFLVSNFGSVFDYFTTPSTFSLTSPTRFASLEERAVAWLFLRWLLDQKGEGVTSQLVQTARTGATNIEAVAGGESLQALFSDFLVATLLDDYPGAAPGQVAPRYQFGSRNLRTIYRTLHTVAPTTYDRPYLLDLDALGDGERLDPASPRQSHAMKPGTFSLFEFRAAGAGSGLTFQAQSGAFADDLHAQVTVVRLPD